MPRGRIAKPRLSKPRVGADLRSAQGERSLPARKDEKSRVGTGAPAPAGRRPAATKSRYNPIAPDRVAEILTRLDRLYPDVTCALEHRSAWELLVATILSAQSTDVNVNRVTPLLFKKYPTVQDFAALLPEQLE